MKAKLFYTLLITLLITNAVLLFMLVKKPHQPKKGERNFLVKELKFDETQREQFHFLDRQHKENMMSYDHQIRQSKDILFNSFSNIKFSSDSISKRIGVLEGKKEQEIFTFFKQVREICTPKQVGKFDKIIKKALHKKHRRPPRRGNMPPPRNTQNK
ncbi:MAG: Spy/CpxP family protein refolding chaperone [Polaribacter sp.]